VAAAGDGLAAAGAAEVAVDDRCAAAVEAAVEEVEALAMVSPNARVAPSTAAPAAVPMSGLVILTWFSFRWCPPDTARLGDPCAVRVVAEAGPGDPVLAGRWPGAGRVARQVPVRQAGLTGPCALLLNPR
jgi:hypothetical protein